jgi:peptidoglycan/xylan/chitin deacetylase (PgdA/CDA1 family)
VARTPPPLILAYHGVSDVPAHLDPEGLFISPRWLRWQIGRLRRWGYVFHTFGAMADRVAVGRGAGCVALTFDDGLADNLLELVPLLHDEGAVATVFPTTGWLAKPHPSVPYARNLTADELRELHRAGVEVGGHTVTHPDLTLLSFEAARDEVRDGCDQLAEMIGAAVDVFAYPFGYATAETIRATAAAGVRAACRVRGEGRWDEPLNLPRQDTNMKSAIGLWLKRDDRYESLMSHAPAKALRRLGKERRRLFSRLQMQVSGAGSDRQRS